jgi:protein-L-isoaspartate(D-aspartate) O-methyltransferase
MNLESARAQMLGQQVRAWDVLDQRVLRVLETTPREQFMPAEYRELAFADTEIPLAHDQSTFAPGIEGRALQALQVEPVDTILEIGTGCAYLTACLARLGARVTSVDIFADFIDAARGKLAEQRVANVELVVADALAMQFTEQFDVIAVGGSVPVLDERFVRLLRPAGRLFIVVGRKPVMEAKLVTMHADGSRAEESLFETVIAPLVNAERPEPFLL